eukprot:scaffold52221_cov28-Prasinocladus_malaysianus.AAC.1
MGVSLTRDQSGLRLACLVPEGRIGALRDGIAHEGALLGPIRQVELDDVVRVRVVGRQLKRRHVVVGAK